MYMGRHQLLCISLDLRDSVSTVLSTLIFVYSAMECSLRLDQSIDRNGVEPIHPDEFLFSSWPLSLVDAGAKYLIEYRNAF